MINYGSSHDEIVYHIQQMEMVLLSDEEMIHIKKFLELKSFIETDSMKAMISEDLKDEKWIEDTKVLIDTALKKRDKHEIIKNHLDDCKGFLIYKHLDKKCKNCHLEVVYQNRDWIFNEVDKREEKSRWINQKFAKVFYNSSVEKKLSKLVGEGTLFKIDIDWIYKNRTLFYRDSIFEDLNFVLLKKNRLKIN